jgi:hypothetical protein
MTSREYIIIISYTVGLMAQQNISETCGKSFQILKDQLYVKVHSLTGLIDANKVRTSTLK